MLGLHYVPGGQGSPGSSKRSAPWTFSYILLHIQVLLGLATFSHGLSRYTCRALRGRVLLRRGGSKGTAVWPRSTTDVSTFPPGVSRSDEIPHVFHVVIKVMRRFSRSVKAFNQ